jgi:hypothetical protein
MSKPWSAKIYETVLLPVAIPPVSPMHWKLVPRNKAKRKNKQTIMFAYKGIAKRKCSVRQLSK